jgi:S-layer protein
VKLWENRQAQQAARISGLGLMAVSLAACGGTDDTPTVTIAQMLASDDLPDVYNVSVTSADMGPVTLAEFENVWLEIMDAENYAAFALAGASGAITVGYSFEDTAANILAGPGGADAYVVTDDPTLSVANLEELEELGATFEGNVTVSDTAANILGSTAEMSAATVVVTDDPDLSVANFEALVGLGATFDGDVTVTDTAANILGSSADLSEATIVVTDTSLTLAQVAALEALGATFGTVTVAQALNTGTDAFVGTSLNDVITADFANGLNKFSAGDTLDGGAGTDTLNITTIANYTDPAAATVTGIENVNITANGSVTANTTLWTGLTALNSTAVGDADLTAAITTNVVSNVSAVGTGTLTVVGGDDVTVNASGLASTGANGTITIGAGTAAAGNVTVDATGTNGTSSIGAITVTAGGDVTVNQTASNAANTTLTLGAVTVTGGASTTTVSVNNDAGVLATASVVGVSVGGAVAITDSAAAGADTIATVNLVNFGATTITSSALTTLNVTGGATGFASGAITLNTQSATTPATALTIISAGGSMGAIGGTQADAYTAITINSSAATTIGDLNANAVTTLNFSGAGNTTITAFQAGQLTALTAINVNGTGGVTLGSVAADVLGNATDFNGGVGADSIFLAQTSTQGITMGGGNDTVTLTGMGAVGFNTAGVANAGTLSGGEGIDTLVMAAADAVTASTTGAFNADVTGFETLRLSDGLANGAVIDVDGLNDVTRVEISTAAAVAATISNLNNRGTIELEAAMTTLNVGIQSAVAGTADVLNLELNSVTGTTFGVVAAANVETINISAADANATPGAAVRHTVSLAGSTNLTSIVVSGNNGMTVTGVATVTNFDASGVVANDASDSAVRLGVSYTSANNTATATVTINGGDGNDTLVGGNALNIINGGAGDDSITGGTLADTIDGGAGSDTYVANAAAGISVTLNGATAASVTVAGVATDTIRNIENVTGTGFADTITGDAAANTIVGGAGNDTITGGSGSDILTGGADADTFVFVSGDTGITLATADTITDFATFAGGVNVDVISTSKAANAATIADGTALTDFAAFVTAADTAMVAGAGANDVYAAYNAAGSGNAWVAVDENDNGVFDAGDTLIVLTGINLVTELVVADFA